jgi:hypothetical protein
MSPREINVHIKELVLHGVNPRSPSNFGDALANELRRLLAARGIPAAWLSSPENLNVGPIRTTDLTPPPVAGAHIAQAIYQGRTK